MEINYLSNHSQLLILTMIVLQSYTINSKRDFVALDCLNHHEDLVMGWNAQWADTVYYVNGVILSAVEVAKILPEQIISRTINQHVVEINIQTLYYINDRLSTKEAVDQLAPDTIESMKVIKYGNAITGLVKTQLVKLSKGSYQCENPLRILQQMPQFPGGDTAMWKYINGKIKYPNEAKEKSIYGKVIAEIIVCSEGTIIDAKIVKGIGGGCDDEVWRVIKDMIDAYPKWIPGKNNGRPAAAIVEISFTFKLQ